MYTKETYEEVAKRYQPLLESLARKFHYYSSPTEDIIQAGRIGLLEAVNKFDETRGASFKTYAYNKIRKEIRNESRRQGNWFGNSHKHITLVGIVDYSKQEYKKPSQDGMYTIEESLLVSEDNPEEFLLRLEKMDQIKACLSVLTKVERAIVELYFFDGLTQEEVAVALGGYTRQNIQRLLVVALKKLKIKMITEGI